MLRWLFDRLNLWVILVGLLIAIGLIVVFGLMVILLPAPAIKAAQTQAELTVIVAPSPTPTKPKVAETATPTTPPSIEGIYVGSYVQISGTEGAGLRLRSGPGTNNPLLFLGMDSEVFKVIEGPKSSDGFTWWHLEAPYDPSRSGWAASKYLKVVSPTPTPSP